MATDPLNDEEAGKKSEATTPMNSMDIYVTLELDSISPLLSMLSHRKSILSMRLHYKLSLYSCF
jgi:hypothetical protein